MTQNRSILTAALLALGLAACAKKQDETSASGVQAPTTQTQQATEQAPTVNTAPQPATATATINLALNTPSTEPGMVKAQELFRQRCVLCHGESGTGNGPASANLQPKPRNYTDPNWQASVTDDSLKAIIVGGGDSVGKSMMMPANPDLKEQPDVVRGLVKIVRGFAAPKQ